MNPLTAQVKATAAINKYGRALSCRRVAITTTYTDSITLEVVAAPIKDYMGELVNPATMNKVIASVEPDIITFKGLEIDGLEKYSDGKLGGLITEDTITFKIPGTITVNVGDIITNDGIEKNVTRVMPLRPGDVTILNIIQIER